MDDVSADVDETVLAHQPVSRVALPHHALVHVQHRQLQLCAKHEDQHSISYMYRVQHPSVLIHASDTQFLGSVATRRYTYNIPRERKREAWMACTMFYVVFCAVFVTWLELEASQIQLCIVIVFNAEIASRRRVYRHIELERGVVDGPRRGVNTPDTTATITTRVMRYTVSLKTIVHVFKSTYGAQIWSYLRTTGQWVSPLLLSSRFGKQPRRLSM